MNKIHIYLRQFSRNRINPDRPDWFDYEKVFVNLLKTIDKNDCILNVCFEREEDYKSHFVSKYDGFRVVFIDTLNIKRKTFFDEPWSHSLAATSEVVEKDIHDGKIDDKDLIYILEDDYLHYPYWPEITSDFFDTLENIFKDENNIVCLYDHNDKYLFIVPDMNDHWGMYKDLKSNIIKSRYRHWRSVPNCGLSMIMRKSVWQRDKEMWLAGYSDCEIGHQVTKNHKTRIWTPIPSLNTHCVKPFIAPFIDWKMIINIK